MKRDIELEATLVAKYAVVVPVLDERSRRRWAAAESLAIGYGGDAVVSSATGLARETIRKGRREIARDEAPTDRIRRPGGGRPRIQQDQPGIQAALEALVDPLTRGDPTSPLRWTCKSRAKLAAALTEQGWRVSSTTVGRLLHRLGYRLQSPRKRQEGATHPDRNAQFEHINRTADEHLTAGQPVISVDTKKKELVGNFKNGGQEWQPKGTPTAVLVHDFPTDAEGKAIPYGVYDMARNEAWVSVGWDHDTPAFAVASIRHWWQQMGCGAYPDATTLFITADAGGSNGYRLHAWKHELQQLADDTGLTIEGVRLFFVEDFSPYSWALFPADASLQWPFRRDLKQASAYRRLSGGQPSLVTAPNTFGLLPVRRAPFWTFARRSGTVPWEGEADLRWL